MQKIEISPIFEKTYKKHILSTDELNEIKNMASRPKVNGLWLEDLTQDTTMWRRKIGDYVQPAATMRDIIAVYPSTTAMQARLYKISKKIITLRTTDRKSDADRLLLINIQRLIDAFGRETDGYAD